MKSRKIQCLSLLLILAIFSSCKSPNKRLLKTEKASRNTLTESVFEIDCSIRALEVEEEAICWFTGSKNKFGFTKDFGKSWKTHHIDYNGLDLEFRSIALTDESVFVLSTGEPALLFKINKNTLDYSLVYKETGERVFYDAMQFWDNKNGIAIGDPTSDCMSILTTKDGGDTWQKLHCNSLPSAEIGEAAFAASDTNISLVGKKAFVVTGGKAANILLGNFYGEEWKKIKTPIIQGQSMTGIFSTDFFNEHIGVIAGGNWKEKNNTNHAMAMTHDGGNSWKLLHENPGFISCVQFIPKTKALLACSTNGIFYSKRLGESWVKISDEAFYNFRFSNNGKQLYFSGNNKLMSTRLNKLLNLH